MGEIELTILQIRAIEILLRKCVPDLTAAEIKSEQMHRYVVEIPPLLSDEEWAEKCVAQAGHRPKPWFRTSFQTCARDLPDRRW